MSLAGNLSDLSLPELLQVVALSRKTGALEICSEGGVAWLGLRDGGIVRVALEGGDLDRDAILEKAGLTEAESDVAAAMLWDAAVQAILGIFDWSEGEFTFEPLDDPALQWRGPQGILLPSPLSPEFLALEGARLEDESAAQSGELRFEGEDAAAEPPEEPSVEAEPVAEQRAEEEPAEEAEPEFAIKSAAPVAPAIEPPPEEPAPPELEALPVRPAEDDTPVRLRAVEEARRDAKTVPTPRPSAPDPDATIVQREPFDVRTAAEPARLPGSLICIDPELALLEKLKSGFAALPVRVHIFQSASDALARFKQYVIRGEVPAVVLGSGIEDPLDARQGLGWRRFAGRLLAIAPRMRIVIVSRPGESVAAPGLAVVRRPEPRAAAGDVEEFLRSVREQLGGSA